MEEFDLKQMTYSMLVNNIDNLKTKNVKSTFNYINLEKLVENFELDITFSESEGTFYTKKSPRPAFISKKYYQSNPELGYNYPPKGPIDKFFVCTYCKQVGPQYHSENCLRPFNSSLVLTEQGSLKYPGRPSGTSYILIVKKPGQKKVITKSIKSEKFSDNVEIIYENEDLSKCTIRISRNGTINIISAKDESLPEQIIRKINKTGSLTPEFPGKSMSINPDITYKYLITAQFNLFVQKETTFVNLNILNNILWNSGIYKKTVKSKDVFMVGDSSNYYNVNGYEYNSGSKESRSNKQTNPYIKFNLDYLEFKINIMIYKRGAIQLRASYLKDSVKTIPLTNAITYKIYIFLKQLFESIIVSSNETNFPVINTESVKIKKGILNLYDGKQPQKCQNRDQHGEIRPIPYSFYGVCNRPGYYVAPRGVKRPDGRYEPCCYKLTDYEKSPDNKKRYQNILKNGYPDGLFDESVPDPDNLSAVFIPGTKILESRRFPGLMDSSTENLLKCMEDTGYIGKKDIFYNGVKDSVLNNYSLLTGTKDLINQGAVALTNTNVDNFTKSSYIITPIFNETINVLLFFEISGKSYFINLNKDVSESGIPDIPELAGTLIEGYLFPFKEPNFIFYPIDCLFFKNINVMGQPFYSKIKNENRFNGLMYTVNLIKTKDSILKIQTPFDLDIINGAHYYIQDDISALLFIPYSEVYTPKKINKKLMMWSDTNENFNLTIGLDVFKKEGTKNRWEVKVENKKIPPGFLPQLNDSIEIPVVFTDNKGVKDGDHVVFKIMLNQIDRKITSKKPLFPISKGEKINDYPDVISILESIQNPLKKDIFTHDGFVINKYIFKYPSQDPTTPLVKILHP